MLLFAAATLFGFRTALGHGRLTVPTTRFPTGYENNPVSGYAGTDNVCRNNPREDQIVPLTAGTTLNLRWNFGVGHVGDCAVFLSYDIDTGEGMRNSEFFKIANLPKCKDQNDQPVAITIPSWVPAGRAVLRWDWYALHTYPGVEFYAQCSDVQITSSSTYSVDDIPSYSIVEPPIYPADGNAGVGFRNPYNTATGVGEQFMTGPPCAFEDYYGNNCALTKSGTTGFVATGYRTGTGTGGGTEVTGGTDGEGGGNGGGDSDSDDDSFCETTIHVVQPMDTVSGIADKFTAEGKLVTTQQICDENKLLDCDSIQPGDNLVIPCDTCCHSGTKKPTSSGGDASDPSSAVRADMALLLSTLLMFAVHM